MRVGFTHIVKITCKKETDIDLPYDFYRRSLFDLLGNLSLGLMKEKTDGRIKRTLKVEAQKTRRMEKAPRNTENEDALTI
jgi:hypothetical protein